MDFKKIKKPDLSKIKKPDLSDIEIPDVEIDDAKVKKFFLDKRVLAVIVFLLLVAIGVGYYFYYWIRRPEYSMEIIRKALATGDINTFTRHVDLDSIYTRAFMDAAYAVDQKNPDEFSRTIAAGLQKNRKDDTVKRFKEVTLSAMQKKKEDHLDLVSYGILGKAIDIFCNNLEKENPAILFAGFKVIATSDENTDIRVVFYDVEKKKNIVMDFRMDKMNDGKWKISRILNLRSAYQSSEYIFNEANDAVLMKKAEEAVKLAEEKNRRYDNFVVLSEEGRKVASFDVMKVFRKQAMKEADANTTMYRFVASAYADDPWKSSMSIYNDFIVDNNTNSVRNTAAILISSLKKELVEFDKIYFMSPSGGFVIDTKLWEDNELGVIGNLKVEDWHRSSSAFLTTTDGLGDVYKLLSKGNIKISFYKGNQLLVAFEANEKLIKSIANAVLANDIIKNKLRVKDGSFEIVPIAEEVFVEMEKAELEKAKKEKEAKEKKDNVDKKDSKEEKKDVSVTPVKEQETKKVEAKEEVKEKQVEKAKETEKVDKK